MLAGRTAPHLVNLWYHTDKTARLIVGARLEILTSNHRADAILRRARPLVDRDGYLASSNRRAVADIAALIDRARSNGPCATVICVGADDEMLIHARALEGREDATALSLRETNGPAPLDGPNGARLLGLTPAEEQVACLLIKGMTINEIAVHLRKSVLTIRTHVKRTYAKMGVSNREQMFARTLRWMFLP